MNALEILAPLTVIKELLVNNFKSSLFFLLLPVVFSYVDVYQRDFQVFFRFEM